MSMSIAIAGTDGIVLATDGLSSTATRGGMKYDHEQKLWQVSQAVGLTAAGDNGKYAHTLIDRFVSNLKTSSPERFQWQSNC
jgi:20S proteasome alpha/beta subunit